MKTIYSIILVLFASLSVWAEKYPHILVKDEDKVAVLDKIEKQAWAKHIFNQTKERLAVYVERHQAEPDWILDRYLMNRIPGKRYTRFISDKEGTQLIGYEGDAPVPTVRVSPHKRAPITPVSYTHLDVYKRQVLNWQIVISLQSPVIFARN